MGGSEQTLWERMSHEERVEALTRFGLDGYSASQIGAELGCTRNAIVGYWGRNPNIPRSGPRGAPKSVAAMPAPKPAPKPKPVFAPAIKSAAPLSGPGQAGRLRNATKLQALARDKFGNALPLYEAQVIAEPTGPGVSMLDRTSRQCSWIRKERGPHGALCCGEATISGTAWCAWHYDVVYVPKAKRSAALKDIDRAAGAAAPTEATRVYEAAE